MTDQDQITSTRVHLADHLARFAGARVLCVGDLMLDRFIYGDVKRISPEAPIPVLRVQRETAMLGGAGNVVRNIVALGGEASVVAVIGDDDAGREVARLIGAEPHISPQLVISPGRRTTTKERYVVGAQQMLRADREDSDPLGEELVKEILRAVDAEIEDVDLVVFSDYAKGVLTPEVLSRVIATARAAGKPIVADPKSSDFSRYRGVSVLTPNLAELTAATGMSAVEDAEVEQAAIAAQALIADEEGGGAILATRSERGMTLATGGEVTHFRSQTLEVFDVSGAGDTAAAALSMALACGAPLKDAAAIANAAAGLVVGKAGTAVAYTDDLAQFLHAIELDEVEAKVVELQRALDAVGRWRARGLSVGFTNGCFDLIHPGHVSLLRQARAACDRLVVGLNTDASVRRLKGEGRPVQSEMARAVVLASLSNVDLVVLFDEDTPLQLIEAILPDVLVKGADYTVDTVVGADIVRAHGGRVLLAELADGFSTSETIAKIAR